MRSFPGLRPLQAGMQKENLAYILRWDHSGSQVYNASYKSLSTARQFLSVTPLGGPILRNSDMCVPVLPLPTRSSLL
jgi:hypothetical protein